MIKIGNTLCFATSYNRKFKHDGDEFMREMVKFSQWNPNPTKLVPIFKPNKDYSLKAQFRLSLKEPQDGFSTFVFFMHGTWRALLGVDYNIWTTHLMADCISKRCDLRPLVNIVLYACSCGRGKGVRNRIHEYDLRSNWDMRGEFGFAMRLAKDLTDIGIHDYRIYAHTGAGHTTRYPHCVWINEENGIIKRRKIVPYRSWASSDRKGRRQWLRWVDFLQQTKTGRFRAPFLTEAELAEIKGD
jgi:hypothetical protein